MIASMTGKVTLPTAIAIILEINFTICPGLYYAHIKIDKMSIVNEIALGTTDPVWIMAGITGCLFSNHMFIMYLLLYIIPHFGIEFITHMA